MHRDLWAQPCHRRGVRRVVVAFARWVARGDERGPRVPEPVEPRL